MTNLYDKEFLIDTLDVMEECLNDLDKWSVYNDDKGNYELGMFTLDFKNLKTLLLKETI